MERFIPDPLDRATIDRPTPAPTSTPRPRTQAELDAYIARHPRPTRDTYDGMYPLHQDMELTDEQVRLVLDYVREVDFHLPGAGPEEFLVVRWARYTGFQFLHEDLEAYAVGLWCTHPGMEDKHTFIRMSWGQLMGDPDAPRLPVNEPVLASDMMTLAPLRDTRTGPSRTGVDAYASDEGRPGVDFDLAVLERALQGVVDHHATGTGQELDHWWTPAVNWGVGLAGRYPRLKYFESRGELTPAQQARLAAFEAEAERIGAALDQLGLAHPAPVAARALEQAARAERGAFRPRLRIRNPRPAAPRAQPQNETWKS
ncbi:hypothetical protein [Mobilicoccus pelagius]|uniref:Uncharacterized protein n=1 Tax=Mobilicoccus pelagius NBRC 104925 TaxID=1089455 RepID=H5UPR9_9MICO|nr:hypothetical protein [Mobilicoccus pelagius]GAB47724.1 hypothetical protein MOPEL_029_00030 [Mobilicoccus pelagius NBRC 104925]